MTSRNNLISNSTAAVTTATNPAEIYVLILDLNSIKNGNYNLGL